MTATERRLHLFTLAVANRLADAAEVLGRLAEKRPRRRCSERPLSPPENYPMPATLKPPHANPAALAAIEAACGLTAAEARGRIATLTPREMEYLEAMASGMDNQDIAITLGISPKTGDIHRANVKHKLQESSATGIPRYWYLWTLTGGGAGA